MLANNSLLTNESHAYEIQQFYYSPSALLNGENFSSLYSFLTYKPDWNEVLLTSNVADTIIVREGSLLNGSNTISVINANSLMDYFIGQSVSANNKFPDGTTVIALNPSTLSLTVSNTANSNYIGSIEYKGMNQYDLVTINESTSSNPLSNAVNFYKGSAIYIDVENVTGGLTYTKTITEYNPETKTVRVDTPFNDSPGLSNASYIRIFNDNSRPHVQKDKVKYIKQIHKDMFYLKKIYSSDFSPVIERIDWEEGTVYDYYRDDLNIREKDSGGKLKYHYYVMNSFYQVFKCLWNNNGGPSTVEPYFVSGNFDDITNIFYDEADKYKWKYMFTVSGSKIQKFLDDDFIPVPLTSPPDIVNLPEGGGGIEVINVITGGNNFNDLYNAVTVTIQGDGTGATATAEIDRTANTVQNITVKTAGQNYTFANVFVTSANAANCIAVAGISPIGGSGADITSELGCEKMMVACYFDQKEDTGIPSDLELRQFGLIYNPRTYSESNTSVLANGSHYQTSTNLNVSAGFGTYQRGERVFQAANNISLASASFYGTCMDFNEAANILYLVDVYGSPSINSSLYGNNSGTSRTLLQKYDQEIVKFSGNVIYIQNIEEVKRSADSVELFRVLLKF
jgi:hypothetical protein